jgi:hypothetical protein
MHTGSNGLEQSNLIFYILTFFRPKFWALHDSAIKTNIRLLNLEPQTNLQNLFSELNIWSVPALTLDGKI